MRLTRPGSGWSFPSAPSGRRSRTKNATCLSPNWKKEPGVTGRVTSLRGFGAFVNLGKAEGLVHISELSWTRIKGPEEVVSVGQELDVQILKVDQETKRISLSHKRTLPEPWESVPERYNVGDIVDGTVTRLADFGAFVPGWKTGSRGWSTSRNCRPGRSRTPASACMSTSRCG